MPQGFQFHRGAARHAGFSLLELLVALAVSAVLAGVGVPSFRSITLNSQRTAVVNDMVSAIALARSEVAKQHVPVVVCPERDGRCMSARSGWNGGWLVFANLDDDYPPSLDDGDIVIRHFPKASKAVTVQANRGLFVFHPFGTRNTNGTITFCDDRGSDHARVVVVAHSGRLRTSDKAPGGVPIECP